MVGAEKQIPCGNDRKKGKSKSKSESESESKSKSKSKSENKSPFRRAAGVSQSHFGRLCRGESRVPKRGTRGTQSFESKLTMRPGPPARRP